MKVIFFSKLFDAIAVTVSMQQFKGRETVNSNQSMCFPRKRTNRTVIVVSTIVRRASQHLTRSTTTATTTTNGNISMDDSIS